MWGEALLRKHLLDDTVVVEFESPVRAVSSTILGGGFRKLSHVVFKRVPREFALEEPRLYAENVVKELGLPVGTTAVFLTAADVLDHVDVSIDNPVGARVLITAGFQPLTCIDGETNVEEAATVNILVVLDAELPDPALVDIVCLVGSVKTLAITDLGLSCDFGKRAYATATDAVVVASRIGGRRFTYGGPVTPPGLAVARLVYSALTGYGLRSLRIEEIFKHVFGVEFGKLVDSALEVYTKAPIPGVEPDKVRQTIIDELSRLIGDPNVWSIGIAAQEVDRRGRAGTIPFLSRAEFLADSKKIVADEILGIALALYINGWKALFSYYWVDRVKERVEGLKTATMFTDDILASLVGSILSRVYDKYMEGVHH